MTDQEIINVVSAHSSGKTLEYRHIRAVTEDWRACPVPRWNFECFDYRVKPEPRAIWVNECDNPSAMYTNVVHRSYDAAKGFANTCCRTVKYIEVVEDGR
jgi:hypothetical protein